MISKSTLVVDTVKRLMETKKDVASNIYLDHYIRSYNLMVTLTIDDLRVSITFYVVIWLEIIHINRRFIRFHHKA